MACACSATYETEQRRLFASRSSFCRRSTMARCGRCCCRGRDRTLASMCPIARVSFGLDAMEVRGPGARGFAAHAGHQGISRREPRRPARLRAARSARAGDHRELRADRAPDGARADRPRASPPASADEGAATERAEMLAARDARRRRAAQLRRSSPQPCWCAAARSRRSRARPRMRPPRWPTSARSRCARTSISSPRSGASSPATSNMSSAAR